MLEHVLAVVVFLGHPDCGQLLGRDLHSLLWIHVGYGCRVDSHLSASLDQFQSSANAHYSCPNNSTRSVLNSDVKVHGVALGADVGDSWCYVSSRCTQSIVVEDVLVFNDLVLCPGPSRSVGMRHFPHPDQGLIVEDR